MSSLFCAGIYGIARSVFGCMEAFAPVPADWGSGAGFRPFVSLRDFAAIFDNDHGLGVVVGCGGGGLGIMPYLLSGTAKDV